MYPNPDYEGGFPWALLCMEWCGKGERLFARRMSPGCRVADPDSKYDTAWSCRLLKIQLAPRETYIKRTHHGRHFLFKTPDRTPSIVCSATGLIQNGRDLWKESYQYWAVCVYKLIWSWNMWGYIAVDVFVYLWQWGVQRLNSWLWIWQNTRVFCSMLFTVSYTGGIYRKPYTEKSAKEESSLFMNSVL